MASDGEFLCTNDPNFAVIYSFLKVFGKLYGLEIPSIIKLQELLENTQEVLEPLKDLHLKLLRRALKSIHTSRWEKHLIKFCHQLGCHQEAWELERFTYKKASTQVKLKVLKVLLEYQFSCHPKFKSAVNNLPCNELRLNPIGRDKNGCVYWYQVDEEANMLLFKEDQDEETWQLVARTREELVNVIDQLKKGENVCPSILQNDENNTEETQATIQIDKEGKENLDDNDEEFLSPETETDQDDDDRENKKGNCESSDEKPNPAEHQKSEEDISNNKKNISLDEEESSNSNKNCEQNDSTQMCKNSAEIDSENKETNIVEPADKALSKSEEQSNNELQTNQNEIPNRNKEESFDKEGNSESLVKHQESNSSDDITTKDISSTEKIEELSETIEEPVMVVTGEGNGADCESFYFIGEEISEPVMYFFGEGNGNDNDTGNTEIESESIDKNENSEKEDAEEINGEIKPTKRGKTSKRLKSNIASTARRILKKQLPDTPEVLRTESKKPCVRGDNSHSSNRNSSENDIKQESSINDNTDSEAPIKNNVKKTRGKLKKKVILNKKTKLVINTSSVEKDIVSDTNISLIEKRKSSLSSDQEDGGNHIENNKENSNKKDDVVENLDLPPKKIRLETTPESDSIAHSKEFDNNDGDDKNINGEHNNETLPPQRKKIKARKGRFKRKRAPKNIIKNSEEKVANDEDTKPNKSLKRSLLNETNSDKIKSESQTADSDVDEEVTSGKRQKIKTKKIIKSSRKKVEEKLNSKQSTDESGDETLYSLAASTKKSKKAFKKKPKVKVKLETYKPTPPNQDSDTNPVRMSRRIAQQKIREEADRRQLEEVTLRELKMIHKKKDKKDEGEEEWKASGQSSSEPEPSRRKKNPDSWQERDDSSAPERDSDSEPLFQMLAPESDLDFGKSDHEFSPESDLESGEPPEPMKRARTLQEIEKDEGFCKKCGSDSQPEWILLCDKCDSGLHAACLRPQLFHVPEGDWFCPSCTHEMLIASLEESLKQYDSIVLTVAKANENRLKEEEEIKKTQQEKESEEEDSDSSSGSGSGSSSGSSSASGGAVYRLRERRQLPVSQRAQEYDRLMCTAIKEEYVEPTTSAGNQGRGKDISTIMEAAEEEKQREERDALAQGKPIDPMRRRKQRRKPRKLNSLDVPSEDDGETDEDFKDTGMESTSESISSDAEGEGSGNSGSTDELPIRRLVRPEKKGKHRRRLAESSPEVKKKRGVFQDTSSESSGAKEWDDKHKNKSKKLKMKKSHKRNRSSGKKGRSGRKGRKGRGLTQYDAEGNVIRGRVAYGLSGSEGENDWSPKRRTRERKIDYTEMPNTESEDEMHKSSGKHMADSSDEFKISNSDASSDSEGERRRQRAEAPASSAEDARRALDGLGLKTAVVPLQKLPDDVTRAKQEELQAHLSSSSPAAVTPSRGRGRGVRGGGRGRGRVSTGDDSLSRLVGVKIKDLGQSPVKPQQVEREKKRVEREAKQAEKEAKKQERQQKREEKEKAKEMRAKDREEKRLQREQQQENKRQKKETNVTRTTVNLGAGIPIRGLPPGMSPGQGPRGGPIMRMQGPPRQLGNSPGPPHAMHPHQHGHPAGPPRGPHGPHGPHGLHGPHGPPQGPHGPPQGPHGPPQGPHGPPPGQLGPHGPPPHGHYGPNQGQPGQNHVYSHPRLQVRPELRGMNTNESVLMRAPNHNAIREGTLSVAGSPQPFKPVSEEPSVITRMPHIINQQYRPNMMYPRYYPPHYPPPHPGPQGHPGHPGSPGPPRLLGPPGHPPHGHLAPGQGLPPSPGQLRLLAPPGHPGLPGPPGQRPLHSPPRHPQLPLEASGSKAPSSPPPVLKSEPGEAPPRHPKVKRTEAKDRARFPLGPYAPQSQAYGPYAFQHHEGKIGGPGPLGDKEGPRPQYAPPDRPHPGMPQNVIMPPRPMPPDGLGQRPPFGPRPALERHLLGQLPVKQEPPEQELPPDRPPPRFPAQDFGRSHYAPYMQQHLRPRGFMHPMAQHFAPQPPPQSHAQPPPQSHAPPPPQSHAQPPQLSHAQPPPQSPPQPPPSPRMPTVKTEPADEPKQPLQPAEARAPAKVQVKLEEAPREEGSVFGGLVSYFSSQHEDELDA